ncbi:Folylpolyglutamate synthase [Ceratocystis platani]|uniref:Folylpolyglutamate synthase n=1 Tax=Ceratocystis fimbriata f. sp. platani TaxID=88771 RepID=A0A0F8D858_CERFI|nr:Folylpolyglutamate synthase [Ceratocystis platani]
MPEILPMAPTLATTASGYCYNPGARPDFHMTSSMADLNSQAMPEMHKWLHRAGCSTQDLADNLRCVHIAGTKGKGSTAAYTASILQNNLNRRGPVGRYTSPHLISVRERIAIDGRPISRELFSKYLFELWDRLSQASIDAGDGVPDANGPATKPMFFRYLTLMALHTFIREGVRDAVIECGIGGEYDATNILPAEAVSASVITHLGIDHTEFLGTTLDEITWHKAGIFKEGVPAFINQVTNASQMRVLHQRAEWRKTPLTVIPTKHLAPWSDMPDLEPDDTPFLVFNQQTRDSAPLITTMMMEYAALTSYQLIFRRAFFSRNESDPVTDGKESERPLMIQNKAKEEFAKFSPKTKTFLQHCVFYAAI